MKNEKTRKTAVVLWVILFANFAVCAVKLIIGSLSGCDSLSADGLHSMSDGASNIVGIIGITLAAKPCDHSHPYGHKKFEILASLFIGIMLFCMFAKILISGISGIINPPELKVSDMQVIAIAITVAVNIVVAIYEYRSGKRYKSTVLIADSVHTKVDVFISVGVLVGIFAIKMGFPPQTDGFISIIISGFIAFSCFEVLRPAVMCLTDTSFADEQQVKSIVERVSGVKTMLGCKSRGSREVGGIEVKVSAENGLSLYKAHKAAHEIEREIIRLYGDGVSVSVHIEPSDEF